MHSNKNIIMLYYLIGSEFYLEQAKKRDHKIFITDIAINKVPYVKTKEMTNYLAQIIQKEHKNILKIAKEENNSNEVLSIISLRDLKIIHVKGDEFSVNPSNTIEVRTLFSIAKRKEIMYLHNHPSTNKFSLPDILSFIREGQLGLISVVTNQGEVYILQKSKLYDFNKTKILFSKIYLDYTNHKLTHGEAVNQFLKQCYEGGIYYEKAK